MEFVKLNGHILPFLGHSELVEAKPSPLLFLNECLSVDHCALPPCSMATCPPSPCPGDCNSSDSSWCTCSQNGSAAPCWPCFSNTLHTDACLEGTKSAPLWIVAAVIPTASVLLVLIFCVVAMRRGKLCQIRNSSQACLGTLGKDHGRGSVAFGLDYHNGDHNSKQPDLIVAGERVPRLESFSHSQLAGFEGSELEYYQLDSTRPVCSCNIPTMQINAHDHVMNFHQPCLRAKQSATQKRKSHSSSVGISTREDQDGRELNMDTSPEYSAPRSTQQVFNKNISSSTDSSSWLSEDEIMRLSILLGQAREAETSKSSFTFSNYDCDRTLDHTSPDHARDGNDLLL